MTVERVQSATPGLCTVPVYTEDQQLGYFFTQGLYHERGNFGWDEGMVSLTILQTGAAFPLFLVKNQR